MASSAIARPVSEGSFQVRNWLSQLRFSKLGLSTLFSGDPMSLTLTDVKRIAHLARLELPDHEAEPTLARLNDFFGLVEQMQAVDTTGIEPLAHPIEQIEEVALRLRDDAVSERVEREEFQRSAPAVQDGLYLVPKVIE
ncbi:glutamyl-tRNA(Gln) amidotransferase subunit C [Caballeronia peredens]|nr:glutamyl-tRNA(Gln) amidotransferase subunit C [Caballeronia peredens]